jgi:hypothetical protein
MDTGKMHDPSRITAQHHSATEAHYILSSLDLGLRRSYAAQSLALGV